MSQREDCVTFYSPKEELRTQTQHLFRLSSMFVFKSLHEFKVHILLSNKYCGKFGEVSFSFFSLLSAKASSATLHLFSGKT